MTTPEQLYTMTDEEFRTLIGENILPAKRNRDLWTNIEEYPLLHAPTLEALKYIRDSASRTLGRLDHDQEYTRIQSLRLYLSGIDNHVLKIKLVQARAQVREFQDLAQDLYTALVEGEHPDDVKGWAVFYSPEDVATLGEWIAERSNEED